MTRRELIQLAVAVLASEALPAFSEPVTLPALPLTIAYEIGPAYWTNGQAFMDLIIDTKQFTKDLEQLKVAVHKGMISDGELQEKIQNGTLFRLERRNRE